MEAMIGIKDDLTRMSKLEVRLLFGLAIVFFMCFGCQIKQEVSFKTEPITNIQLTNFPIDCSIRAIEVIDSNHMWFAGSNGQYGYTEDGGRSWHRDSIQYDTLVPEFRSIAVTDKAVFLLSVASPALLYQSTDKGQSWELVYQGSHPNCFYDAMAFRDAENGIAVGDPTDGCLSVIMTSDGGSNWRKLSCDILPATIEGEACFAASNSNVSVYENHIWLVTGGMSARVFHSADWGESWEVFETPIQQGGQMTGIFTADFYNQSNGFVFGGNWEEKTDNTSNKALTNDGGRTWSLVSDGSGPGYRSGVRFRPHGQGEEILAVGSPGISYSKDFGQSWIALSDSGYYTIRFDPNGEMAWLAGNNKLAKLVW